MMQFIFFLPALGIPMCAAMVIGGCRPMHADLIFDVKHLGSWDAVKKTYNDRNHEMWDRIEFRKQYVLDLLTSIKDQGLQITWPTNIPGSRTLTSDFDITISVAPGARVSSMWDDVKAARLFNSKIKEVFHASPAKTFDTNIYVGEFSAPGQHSSLSEKSNQVAAALTKVRRYMNTAEWNHFSSSIENNFHSFLQYITGPDITGQNPANFRALRGEIQRFQHSMKNLDEAEVKYIFATRKLYDKLHEGAENGVVNLQGMPFLDDDYPMRVMRRDIATTDPDKVLDAEYALYLDGMEEVRSKQFELELLLTDKMASREQITILKETIKRLVTDAVIFAPEAYSSEGGFYHIVKYEQSGKTEFAWKQLTHFDLFCSANEQVGDFLKDVNYHFEGDFETGMYQSSKYLMRFYDAVQKINQKISESSQDSLEIDISKYQVKLSGCDPGSKKQDVEVFKEGISLLLQIRKAPISKHQKRARTKNVVETAKFGDLFGSNMAAIQTTIIGQLAQLSAEYQVLFDMRP